MTASEFEYVRRLVADESALALSEDKGYLVQSRLQPVATREGLGSVSELIDAVRDGEPQLRRELVEALVTHETQFFRDGHPFQTLRDVVLPELSGSRRLALWSAATSTGQEAYSLALLVRDALAGCPAPRLLATDLSEGALRRARAGRFSDLEVRRGLPSALRDRYFVRHGAAWQVCDEIRRMIDFAALNLARPFADAVGPMDVVLLRNVLIYFGEPARRALVEEVAAVLRPGGYLMLGGAEAIWTSGGAFEQIRTGPTTLYRRTAVGG